MKPRPFRLNGSGSNVGKVRDFARVRQVDGSHTVDETHYVQVVQHRDHNPMPSPHS